MIHLIGMSHAINVLKAASREPLALSHDDWVGHQTAGRFFDVPTRPGLCEGDLIKAFIITPASGWGPLAVLRQADGRPEIAAAPGYWELLATVPQDDPDGLVVSVIHGSEHSMLSMLQHPQPFDFHWPPREDLALIAGYQPIPLEVVTRQVEASAAATIAALTAMRAALPKRRIVHLMPPPPVASEAQIMKAPEVFAGHLQRHGITPLSIRLKYHGLYQAVLDRALAPLRIATLAAPAAALNPDGSLAEAFVQGCTHGNAAYGALVIDQLAGMLPEGVH